MNVQIKKKIIFVNNAGRYLQMKVFILKIWKFFHISKWKKFCHFVFHMIEKNLFRSALGTPQTPVYRRATWEHCLPRFVRARIQWPWWRQEIWTNPKQMLWYWLKMRLVDDQSSISLLVITIITIDREDCDEKRY